MSVEPDNFPPRLSGTVAHPSANEGVDWSRIFSALRRRSWIVALVMLLGTGVGFLYARSVNPVYTAEALVWFEETSGTANVGPIQSGQILEMNAWEQLFKSFEVLDHVVEELDLYLAAPARDSALFRSFDVADEYVAGRYGLSIGDSGAQWRLTRRDDGTTTVVETGVPGDSIGRDLGLRWAPGRDQFEPGREVEFTLNTIRDGSRALQAALATTMDEAGNFMRIRIERTDPELAAEIINLTMEQFLEVAAIMKRGSLSERGADLYDQLARAEARMDSAEAALESFRVATSALPGTGGAAAASATGGASVQADYFDLRARRADLVRERDALQRALQAVELTGSFPTQTLLGLTAVQESAGIERLLTEIAEKEAERRDLLIRYTPTSQPVREIEGEIAELETEVLRDEVRGLAEELTTRITGLDDNVGDLETDLQAIPSRTREEQRLMRNRALAEERFLQLQTSYDELQLAEISSIPDLQVLDYADPTQIPESQPGIFILLFALFGSLGVGLVLVILLDRADHKLRYPSQITQGMGLNILGGIPRLRSGRGKARDQSESEVIEAFRSLRLNLDHSYGSAGPTLVTITSPDMGDGKSFVSANLANAYARQGRRTIVIDGDTRRGTQHTIFGSDRIPGLTGYLDGDTEIAELIRYQNGAGPAHIPSGRRSEHSPEQLSARRMRDLITHLKSRFDVILIDTPPMSAGVDPLALATLTGNLLLVLRTGETDVDLAESNLQMLDQLPVRVLGAVLNDISTREQGYRRYGYRSDYAIEAETVEGRATPAPPRLLEAGTR